MSNPEMPWPDLSDLVTVLAAGESPSSDLDVITAATCRLLSVDAAVLSNAHDAVLAQATPRLSSLGDVPVPPLLGDRLMAMADTRTATVAVVRDLRHVSVADAAVTAELEVADRLGIRAMAHVLLPLVQEDGEGSLTLYSRKPRRWSGEDLGLAGFIGTLTSAFLTSATRLDNERNTVGQLQHALDSRVMIEQAKGVLVASESIGADEAFGRLRDQARRRGVTVRSIAEAVVNNGYRPGPQRSSVPPRPRSPRASG
ncbi:ANTAR domain-containing protein [Nocardioides sp. NPDC057577]|uniref:ANTAR domain-containing protein n=1 Tax=Nocardioides sp. NPDC057577 TaxID=3346171 RepID=UPI0036722D87